MKNVYITKYSTKLPPTVKFTIKLKSAINNDKTPVVIIANNKARNPVTRKPKIMVAKQNEIHRNK